MFSILNSALSWAITSFGNKFYLKKRSRLNKALDNRFYVKFMRLEIDLLLKDMWKKFGEEKCLSYFCTCIPRSKYPRVSKDVKDLIVIAKALRGCLLRYVELQKFVKCQKLDCPNWIVAN